MLKPSGELFEENQSQNHGLVVGGVLITLEGTGSIQNLLHKDVGASAHVCHIAASYSKLLFLYYTDITAKNQPSVTRIMPLIVAFADYGNAN